MYRGRTVSRLFFRGTAPVAVAVALACAGTPAPATPSPERAPRREPKPAAKTKPATIDRAPLPPLNPHLPQVPGVDGPLDINVVYPTRGALVGSRDSNFVFGSVGSGLAALKIDGHLVPVWPNGAFLGWVPNPPADSQWYELVAYTLSDTARLRYPVRTRAGIGPRPPYTPEVTTFSPSVDAILRNDSLDRTVSDTDDVIIGRPSPAGDYEWFLFPGTVVRLLEYRDDMARVQLDPGQDIWVDRRDVKVSTVRKVRKVRPKKKTRTHLRVVHASMSASHASVDLNVAVASAPAYIVSEGDRDITLTLYNTIASGASARLVPITDPLIQSATQSRESDRTIYHFALTRPVYGYETLYEHGTVKLRIRRPPIVDPAEPLRGMTIVVDPGHPPIGATGPTGLWEPVPTLAVGLKVRDLLEARGVHVVMTRTTAAPVALGDRPIIARRADANAFVSIHLNADADGQNPFRDNGTGTYYFHPQSKLLAQTVLNALVPELGLRDRGVFYQNLAVCRPTWFPAVLAEGLFIIMPDQEAAIRTPEYQDAYARGVVNGLEKFFATFAK